MRYRPLGHTGLDVSEIGFGCASYWGRAEFPEAQALALVDRAIERGVTLFDTGASYSAGQAEPRLGRALRHHETDRLVIATKAGTFKGPGGRIERDFSPAAIVASAERSLCNLSLERLPLLQLHGPGVEELTDDLREALADLKARGLVRAVGVNSFDPAVIEHVIGLADIDVVMVDFNVLKPQRAALIGLAAAAGKGVLAGMPLAMGHTAPWRSRLRGTQDLWYLARALVRHRDELWRGRRFRFLHHMPGITGSQAALAYVLAHPGVAAAVVGATRVAHLDEDLDASGRVLDRVTLDRIVAAQQPE
jgi:aryl-alcohol dehydrogenase-like predicted oxidoreductase